jgi:hypothetical protein
MDEVKLAADLRVALRDQTERLAQAEAAIERVRALAEDYALIEAEQLRDALDGEEA